MKYDKRIKVSIILGLIGLSLVIVFAIPKIIYQVEVKNLEKEVLEINTSLKDLNFNKKELIDKLTNDIFILFKDELEDKIENDLKLLIDITYDFNNINVKDILTIENIDSLENRNITKEKIKELNISLLETKNKINILMNQNRSYIDSNNLSSKLLKINHIIDTLDYINKVIDYLNNTNNYYVKDNKIIFTKKSSFIEIKELLNYLDDKEINIADIKMENDDVAPVISPLNLELFVGNKNIKDNIKCIDEIDGEVECKISGIYDLNVVGYYNVSVEAIDSSNNYVKKNIELNVKEKVIGPYYTEVIRNQNTIIVYGLDENNQYTKVVKVFACSTGRGGRTPTGTFYTTRGSEWGLLMGGVWGQYYTMITPSILFHSVPYYSKSKDNLEWQEYNKLGSEASAGCVRLSTIDAKWIYDNCPSGMRVRIYDGELPNGVTKPTPIKIDPNSQFKGWDPTDPDVNNPWKNL